MKYARLMGREVVELFELPQGFTIKECFHESIVLDFVEIPEGEKALPGYIYDFAEQTFSPPPAEEPASEAPVE